MKPFPVTKFNVGDTIKYRGYKYIILKINVYDASYTYDVYCIESLVDMKDSLDEIKTNIGKNAEDKIELIESTYESKTISFGAKDSELVEETIAIPEGYEAVIEGNLIHIKPVIKFKKDDFVILESGKVMQIEDVTSDKLYYNILYLNGKSDMISVKDLDKKARLYDFINDIKVGDFCVYYHNGVKYFFIYKNICGDMCMDYAYNVYAYFGFSETDINVKDSYCKDDYPFFKMYELDEIFVRLAFDSERDIILSKLTNEGYKWNDEYKILEEINRCWRDENREITGYGIYTSNPYAVVADYGGAFNEHPLFATKAQAKSALAMARISQIMTNDKRFGGMVTDEEWERYDEIRKYCIYRYGKKIEVGCSDSSYCFLAFHTAEQRDLFLEENDDLVKDYLMIEQ